MLYRRGTLTTLHTSASSFPVPTGNAGGVVFIREGLSSALVTDLILRPNAVGFSVTGPVNLWARVNGVWLRVELIETTAAALTTGGVSYRINLSPWWERIALESPWVAPGVERVTVEMRTYEGVAF